MEKKIEICINQLIKEGYKTQDISAIFNRKLNRQINLTSSNKKPKKTKKKKICRSVLVISDSSCDEFN
jgi:hypothetical protein